MSVSLNTVHQIWNGVLYGRVEVGFSRDRPELTEIRFVNSTGVTLCGLAVSDEQLPILIEALQQILDAKSKVGQSRKAPKRKTAKKRSKEDVQLEKYLLDHGRVLHLIGYNGNNLCGASIVTENCTESTSVFKKAGKVRCLECKYLLKKRESGWCP